MYQILKGSPLGLVVFFTFFFCEVSQGQLALTGSNNFVACGEGNAYSVTVNQASKGDYSGYKIEWGDGKVSEEAKFVSLTHVYTAPGNYTLRFYGKTGDGWSAPVSYTVKAENKAILIQAQGSSSGAVCKGKEMVLNLTELGMNSASTSYTVDYGDGSDPAVYSGQMNQLTLKHTYTKSSCEDGTDGFYITVSAINSCNTKYEPRFGPYPIAELLKLTLDMPNKECTGFELDLDGRTQVSPRSCGALLIEKKWTRNGEEVTNSYQVFETPGIYTFVATATMEGLDCGNNRDSRTIKIIQRIKAIASPLTTEICEGGTVNLKGSGSEGDEKKYLWSVARGDQAQVVFSPDATAADPVVTFKKHGTYRLRLLVYNDCSSDETEVEVVVKKDPEITGFKPLPSICPGTLRLNDYITYDWTWEKNPKKPQWSVDGPAGGAEFLLGSGQAEYPVLKFTKPGEYTLKVELTSVGCAGEKLKAQQKIVVYDPEIYGEITVSASDVCENIPVVFTNGMSGVELQTAWEVTRADGSPAEGMYSVSENADAKTRTYIFSRYGDYRVKAFLTAACKSDYRQFNIKVRRAPEVYFTSFPDVICPESPFLPGNYVNFLPNGNDAAVNFTWEVTGADPVTLEGATTRNPKIIFPVHGDYTIRLTINNPVPACASPSLSISKVVKVSNPKMDLKISPDKNTICVNGQVKFINDSEVGVEPKYTWGISPDGFAFAAGSSASSKAPVVEFNKSGIYSVTTVVNGVCRPETLPFTIVVQEDPEVTLDAIPAMCPGGLNLTDELVHYQWNDSWKSSAESTRRVVWKLLSKPDAAVCTPPESVEWDALLPKLEFKTPGEYELQVEVKSDAACGGKKLVASRKVTVYDPALYIDVKPQLSADVVQLPGVREYQAVERKPVVMENNSLGVGINYHWTVSPAANAVISDPAAKSPSITFTKFGVYTVRVDLNGTCNDDFYEFTMVVKGVPKFDFQPIANRCDSWEEIDIRDFLRCDSAGSTEIFCNWSVSPASGYTLTEGTTSDMFYKIKFHTAGRYTLTLNATAEYGGIQTVTQQVNILRSALVVRGELSKTEGCTTDGLQVITLNKSDGDSVSYTWSVTPIDGRNITQTPEKLTVDFIRAGNYQIVLHGKNICTEDSKTYGVRAYSKPEVAVIGSSDLGTVCEKGYVFAGGEHIGNIQVNNDALKFVRWTVSPVGASFTNGTAWNSERPDFTFAGGKNYRITGEFKNGCQDTVKVGYTLAVDEFIPVALMPDTVVCAGTEPFRLRAQPHGGDWRCEAAGMLREETGKNFYFDPYKDTYKVYEMTYRRGNGQCLDSARMHVTVNKLPVVNAGDDRSACLNNEPQPLRGILPADGEWKGTGVQGNVFYPDKSGKGDFRLEYWYTEATTGCPNLDTIRMTVHGLPDPGFKASLRQCRTIDSLFVPVELGKGNRFDWDFGNGETRVTQDAPVTYAYPAHGEFQVRLVAASPVGCSDTSGWTSLKVLDPPPAAEFTLLDTAGCGPFTTKAEIDPAHFAGEYYDLNYLWNYGNGSTSEALEPQEQTYLPGLFDTTYQLVFKVYNICGEQLDTAKVGAWSQAVARFAMFPESEFCTPVDVMFINQSTGSHNQYSWDFDDGSSSAVPDPEHTFTTGNSMSVFNIKLRAENRCTPQGTVYVRDFKVKPNTILAGFSKDKKYLCAGDTVCFVNSSVDRDPPSSLNYSWDFGDGEISSAWDTCHRYTAPGTYVIALDVSNGCASRIFKDSVFVHSIPLLTLEGEEALCEDLELELKVSSDVALKNVTWDFGDGTTKVNGLFLVKHAFQEPGMYQVKVRGEANQMSSCPGETLKTVQVWSNPRVKILPLDTMGCPPFLYRPEVIATSYDYFTWDYGDGSPLTSEMEYTYANDTNFIISRHITAYVENNYGCKEQHSGLIRIYNGPKVAWDKEISYGRPEKVRFINLSRDYTEAYWYLPSGEVVNSFEDQLVTFDQEGVYPLSLTVMNEYGCRDSIYQEYRSYESGLYFPNSFIPHSTNPKVNRFNGIGMGLKEYKLEIFDMYGNKVWETRALEGGMPSEGWDGCNKNGQLLPQGTYIWRAEAIFFSEDVWTGKNNRSGKPQTTQGTVLMLKK